MRINEIYYEHLNYFKNLNVMAISTKRTNYLSSKKDCKWQSDLLELYDVVTWWMLNIVSALSKGLCWLNFN